MSQEFIDPVLDLISSLIHYELGSTRFYIVLAAFVMTWIMVARILMGFLKSDRGYIAALLALAFPLFFGLLAYGLVDWQIVPQVEADWAGHYLAPGVSGLVALLIILIISKRMFLVDGFAAILIFAFASAAAVGACLGAEIVLQTLEKGGEKIKQREERSKDAIDSVL